MQHIVISEKDFTENKDIVIAHEYAHIKNLHAIDLLICELFTAIHWFNPFMWLLRRDLKLIHEYQADQAVLNKGIDAKKYQLLVVEKAVGERRFAMANHFTQKPILKRIKMMHRKKENYWKGVKLIFFVPIVILLLQAFAAPEIITEKIKENIPEKIAESQGIAQEQNKSTSLIIEVRKDGNYIDNKSCSLDEIVNKAKSWQKTGREDFLLLVDKTLPYKRTDEIREALENAKVYHVNQSFTGSDDIIYPANDVSAMAEFKQGKFGNWIQNQIQDYLKSNTQNQQYPIGYSFVIDQDGIVKNAHIVEASNDPQFNTAFEKILAQIPDWRPAKKGGKAVSVYYNMSKETKIVQVLALFMVLKKADKNIDLNKLRNDAEKMVKKSNNSCKAVISAEDGVPDQDIKAVKEVLKKAGIREIEDYPFSSLPKQ